MFTYPTRTTAAVHILLESLDAFVEVVVVVRAHVDEDAMAENFTQVLLAGPVICDVTREVERLPILDSLVVDLSGDFVPWLPDMLVDCADMWRVTTYRSHLQRIAVQALCAEDCVPNTVQVSVYSL